MADRDEHERDRRVPLDQLDQEWRFAVHGALARAYRDWCIREPLLRAFADPGALVVFLQRDEEDPRKDELLAALLRLAGEDPLAARVVLQALRPGLKRLAGRTLFEADERELFWEALLAHVWERIRSYPLERRPARIAANLLFDSLQQTTRELGRTRRRAARRAAEAPESLAAVTEADRDPELVLRDAVHAGAISETEARLIYLVRLERRPLAEAAAKEQLAYNVARVRLQRAERRLLLHLGYPVVPKRRRDAPSSSARARKSGTAN